MPPRDGIEYRLWRHALGDGEVTTLYAVLYPRRSTRARVLHFPRAERLDVWCRTNGVEEAFVGGFYLRDPYRPLGELWVDGRPVPHEPVAAPYAERRGSRQPGPSCGEAPALLRGKRTAAAAVL
jgi:hypothetical protein